MPGYGAFLSVDLIEKDSLSHVVAGDEIIFESSGSGNITVQTTGNGNDAVTVRIEIDGALQDTIASGKQAVSFSAFNRSVAIKLSGSGLSSNVHLRGFLSR